MNAADDLDRNRARMVDTQIVARGITNTAVLGALRRVPRHEFVPTSQQRDAYHDSPLPIGHGQTISQPYIVALMTELLDPQPGDKLLEVGTGSGYQAAILAALTTNVWTIEILRPLADEARPRLVARGLRPEQVRCGDGYHGWPEQAPFDGIMVTAAVEPVPQPLVDQLKPGGRMVIPVGQRYETQRLTVLEKDPDGRVRTREVLPVIFVPLTRDPQRR